MNKLGLINYEGNCLEAVIKNGQIYIKDQYGVHLEILTPSGLFNFMDGEFEITDSKGTKWNYLLESEESKPKMSKVMEFVDSLKNSQFLNKCKTKILEVKLDSLGPAADILQTQSFIMEVIDDEECVRRERLVIHIGECLYRIDNKGFIIERIIPHE